MRALLRRWGLVGPPPAALHRKWLDTLCRPPEAGQGVAAVPRPSDAFAGEGLEPPVARERRSGPSSSMRSLLGPPKH